MTSFGVSDKRLQDLRRRMHRLGIFEKDIKESFIRASGPGGQNVNKVSTCVVLLHRKAGVQVKAQEERTQGLNRYRARCRLTDKIERQQKEILRKRIDEREKTKRRNRKKPKALKEKILEYKKKQSQKKQARQRIRPHKITGLE